MIADQQSQELVGIFKDVFGVFLESKGQVVVSVDGGRDGFFAVNFRDFERGNPHYPDQRRIEDQYREVDRGMGLRPTFFLFIHWLPAVGVEFMKSAYKRPCSRAVTVAVSGMLDDLSSLHRQYCDMAFPQSCEIFSYAG